METHDMERQLAHLAEQVEHLLGRVDRLATRVAALEQGRVAVLPQPTAGKRLPGMTDPERVWQAVGSGSLMVRLASLCFMLVVALILRTVTDEGFLTPQLGATLGIGYALALVVAGWPAYRSGRAIAPVLPLCGAGLLFVVILETHGRFASLSTPMAFGLLLLLLALLAAMGLAFRHPPLLSTAVLGCGVVAVALDFPQVHFAEAAGILWCGMLIALVAHFRKQALPLKWLALFWTALFWLLWSFKLSVPLQHHKPMPPELAYGWFFPFLAAFLALWLASTLVRLLRSDKPLGFFHGMLPTLAVLLCLTAAWGAIPKNAAPVLGRTTVVLAGGLYLLAALVASRRRKGAPGCNAFSFAATVALAVGLYQWLGLPAALPYLSATAVILAMAGGRWQSGGCRFTSYLLQGGVCLVLLTSMRHGLSGDLTAAMAASTALFAGGAVQYAWCRHNRPPLQDSAYFAWLDRKDVGAIILLLSSLVGAFGLFRLGLSRFAAGEDPSLFSCGQTVIINLVAIVLLLLGGRERNREFLGVALAIIALAAVKVFFFDLFKAKGLPLVASVFSFGIVALVGSLVLRRSVNGAPTTSPDPDHLPEHGALD